MSQKPDDESLVKYNVYCSTDGKRDFARGVYGATLLPLKAKIFLFLESWFCILKNVIDY